jgi:multicomponent K+:H+ antiporter subunit E
MTVLARAIPQPGVSLVILVLWLLLAPAVTVGQALLGAAAGLLIPRLTQVFWPDRPRLRSPWSGLRLVGIVLYDIVVANWIVARRVVGPLDRLHPAFLEVPLDLRDGFVATILGSIVSLTPGTVSVDIDRERWVLFVHALDVRDTHSLAARIKARYETPLKEVFAC